MTAGGREEDERRPVEPGRSVSQEEEERGDTDEGGVEGGDKERVRDTGEKGDGEHRTEEAPGGRSPPYVSPCLGELRKESGSKAGGMGGRGWHGEGEERGEGGEVAEG